MGLLATERHKKSLFISIKTSVPELHQILNLRAPAVRVCVCLSVNQALLSVKLFK